MTIAPGHAQTIPGPADINRLKPEERLPLLPGGQNLDVTIPAGASPVTAVPPGAENIHLIFMGANITGASVFAPAQLRALYAPYLGRDITLDKVYTLADAVTQLYRDAGYFLSLAYVPVQHIKGGVVTIQVVEGSITDVELPDNVRSHSVVQAYIERLLAQKPLTSQAMESFLLRINDLPGYSFRAVLSSAPDATEGAITLTLAPTERPGQVAVSFDNSFSRFLGPHELTAEYSASMLPLQQTTISALSGLPTDKLKYATLEQAIVIAPDLTLDLLGSFTKAHPGFTLEPDDVRSESAFLSAGVIWQYLRQRQENLSFKLSLDRRNTATDFLGAPFTRDHIRALRANAAYDFSDHWRGANTANLTISKGLNGFGSSNKTDLTLSRAGAAPDFAKAELALSRQQSLGAGWSLSLSADGQLASGPLYSSEQFGYGGAFFGRAFDTSDLTGDEGVSGALEVRYGGWQSGQGISPVPYAFYDIGQVWNKGNDLESHQSGASAGFGARIVTGYGVSGNLGLAFPLTREIGVPIYGHSRRGPRLLLQVSYGF